MLRTAWSFVVDVAKQWYYGGLGDLAAGAVDEHDPSLGTHAALLYNMSGAVKAFYDDLNQLEIDEKVLSLTFTEFGRRAKSNDSYGTDHGTATPVFVFGTQLNNGIYGVNPSLKPEDLHNYNLVYNIDYRQIYTSIIQDWFEGDDQALIDTGFSDWVDTRLPIVDTGGTQPIVRVRIPHPSIFIQTRYRIYFISSITLNSEERLVSM